MERQVNMQRPSKFTHKKKRPALTIVIYIPANIPRPNKNGKQDRRTAPYYLLSNYHKDNDEPLVERDFEG